MKSLLVVSMVCLALLAGIAVYDIRVNPVIPSTSTTSQSPVAGGTVTVNAKTVPVPAGCSLAKTVSSQGYELDVYLPSAPRAGSEFCILIVVHNLNHTNSPGITGYGVRITDSNGKAMDVAGCLVLASNPEFPVGNWDSCGTYWHTAVPSKSTEVAPQPGTYHIRIDVLGVSLSAETDTALSA